MTSATFSLSFHVSHPNWEASAIRAAIDLPVEYAQTVGGERATPRGTPLEGVYKRTNVHFAVHEAPLEFDMDALTALIERVLNVVGEAYTQQISASGGSSHLMLGVFSDDNVMLEFAPDILARLGAGRVGLKVDFYGGEE